MFFYRAWAGNEGRYPQSALSSPDFFTTQFAYHRWGYATLLILTLVACLVLNIVFVASFVVNFSKQKMMPHILFLLLSIRDLLVAIILIPICIDWFIINVGYFEGDEIFCKFAGFLDFFLAAEYPILLIMLSIILYTRKYPKLEEGNFGLPMDEFNPEPDMHPSQYDPGYRVPSRAHSTTSSYRAQQYPNKPPSVIGSVNGGYNGGGRRAPSVVGSVNGYGGQQRAPSVVGSVNGYGGQQRAPSVVGSVQGGGGRGGRAPSVAGSDTGYRSGGNAFRPQRPVILNQQFGTPGRPGSVTGSIEGRLAAGRRTQQLQQQHQTFLTSSPLREEDEDNCEDLWDAASLDYPGNQSPTGWEFLAEEEDENNPLFYEEPKFHTWHYWLMGLTWGMALGIGVPAAMFTEHHPFVELEDGRVGAHRKGRPGCYIPADPFKNPYSTTVDDPGFNFTLSNLIITYIFPVVLLIFMIVMIYCKKITDNPKFQRYVKILVFLSVIFVVSRSPMDIIQLKGIVEAAMGFKQLNVLPYQLEYEILLIWSTYIPLIAHPIVYLCLCSEYRSGGLAGVRKFCGCPVQTDEQKETLSKYKEEEILASRSSISKTQVSNIL